MPLNPDFVNELRRHFFGDIRLDPGSRVLYSTDASIYQIDPLGVVLPRTQDDLHAAVELAAKYRIPILPRGSGSSLAGQAIGEALILDCSRWLDGLIEIQPEARTATVEPGFVLADLNRAAAKYGLQFGPDPASAERATMGGVIANNATGAHSISFGMTADHVLSADVIEADGGLAHWSVIDIGPSAKGPTSRIAAAALDIRERYAEAIKTHYPKSWRNSAGYRLNYLLPWAPSKPAQWSGDEYPPLDDGTINLAQLLAGSEGTLAVIRRATVRLVAKPKYTALGILAFESIADACDAVPELLKKHHPSAVELIPRMILQLARGVPAYARQMGWVRGDPSAVLAVEFSGDRPEVPRAALRQMDGEVVALESPEEQGQVWNVRKVGLGILDSRPVAARPVAFIEDCAIPVERLGDFVREIERILAEHGIIGGIYAHASAGCLHIRPILDLKSSEGVRALRSIAAQTLALTLQLGGAMASEHGDGLARAEWLRRTYGDEVAAAMRILKQAADPNGLLNPGKMLDAPKMDQNLRYGDSYHAHTWKPAIDFGRNGGLSGAIEQCNGQSVCRQFTGVMCPSFQATRDEKYSTRGRANLLRALISRGSFDEVDSVAEALDLCLACKGCKAECPSGVDMAKIKFAFQDEYYKSHRRPLRDYLFGYFDVAARFASALAPITNLVTKFPPTKSVISHALRITPERPFPEFRYKRANVRRGDGPRRQVIFLSDAFTRFVEPQVEQAAFDLLHLLGFDVRVFPVLGAGAALMSKGLLGPARRHAQRAMAVWEQLDPGASLLVVGLEPPEIYALKHDYPDLLPQLAESLAKRTANVWLLDEFLIRFGDLDDFRVANFEKKIYFHPHCHQHAESLAADGLPSGTQATLSVLQACGYDVELIDAGCCGMAGTFGYEAEHYDLSMAVGELKLFPFVRERNSEERDIFATTGAACRMQIRQGTGVSAEHPVVLIERALRAAAGSAAEV